MCCYNIYFITIYNEYEEKLVYIGKTDSKSSRFSNGHLVALKLHNPRYQKYYKRVYFGTIMFLSEEKEYIPLEFIRPYKDAAKYLAGMEGILIERLKPELNVKHEAFSDLEGLSVIHIQNFTEKTEFFNDKFI